MAERKRDWLKEKMMGRKGLRQWAFNGKISSLSSAWRRWRQNRRSPSLKPFILWVAFDRFIFSLKYTAEAVVLVGYLCFFYLRFGFRL